MSLELALQLKKKGRGPDTELVHMTKGEVAGLHRLARAVYGQRLPVNPETGLVEAGWLKSLLPTIVGGAVSYYTGSSAAGAAAGAATGAATNKGNRMEGAITGGLQGYGGGQLGAALADQGIGSLGTMAGWEKLLGNAAVPAGKDAAGNPIAAQKATGLGGWGGALQAGGLGIGVPLLMGSGGDGGGKSDKASASSIMQDPNAPASYRLKRMYMGGAKQPGASESSEKEWFRYVYEPTGLVKGAEGGAVSNLPSSQKAYDYLHRRGKLDKPAGGDLDLGDEPPTDGVGTPPPAGDDSGGAPPQTVKPAITAEEVAQTYAVNPKTIKAMEKDKQAGRYYDPEKIKEALSRTAPGKDGRTVLKDKDWKNALLPISGLVQSEKPYEGGWIQEQGESGGSNYMEPSLGRYKDQYGQSFNVYQEKGDGNVYLKYWHPGDEGFGNITGSGHDRVTPTYRLDPKTGTAVPINANTSYEASDWVDYGRDLAKMAAVMATAGVAGTALAGAGGIEGLMAGAGAAGGGGAGVGGTLAESLGAGVVAGSPAEAAALEAGMTAGAGGMGGGSAAGGIGSTLSSAYQTASPYLKYAQTGLSALNTLQGQPKAAKGTTGEQSEYVPPADAVGSYGGRNLFAPKPPKKAAGGVVPLQSGGFVFPADVVSAVGAGSSSAGLELLAKKYGAMPIGGKGHGQSDDVHAMIDGEQPARVARDEAVLDAEQVAAIGGGDPKKGAKKLYALMDRVRKQSMGHTRQMRPVKLKELA